MSNPGDSSIQAQYLDAPSVGEFDPFADVNSTVLRAAARRIAGATAAGVSRDKTVKLRALVRCLECNEPEVFAILQSFEPSTCLAFLDGLRAEVIRGWTPEQPQGTTHEIITFIEASDRVRVWLDGRIDASAGQRPESVNTPAAGALLPPSGMNLAVEIAHDLRSPLTSILFLSETLRRGQSGDVTDLQHRQLGLIYAAALGMVSLASNLIELGQGDDRLLEQNPAPFSVTESLESICDIVRPLAEEKKLALRVLPPSVDHRIGFVAAMSRVLLNLLTNALQNTEEGFVEIAVRPKGVSFLEFSVRDTGTGLNDEARDALFDPFRRVRKSSRFGFSGSGLGLAICQRLLKAMQSELQYETSPGWGTRFYFDLDLPPAQL